MTHGSRDAAEAVWAAERCVPAGVWNQPNLMVLRVGRELVGKVANQSVVVPRIVNSHFPQSPRLINAPLLPMHVTALGRRRALRRCRRSCRARGRAVSGATGPQATGTAQPHLRPPDAATMTMRHTRNMAVDPGRPTALGPPCTRFYRPTGCTACPKCIYPSTDQCPPASHGTQSRNPASLAGCVGAM